MYEKLKQNSYWIEGRDSYIVPNLKLLKNNYNKNLSHHNRKSITGKVHQIIL